MGHKKSDFFKMGVKPLLLPGVFKIQILCLDQFLAQIWAQRTKKRPNFLFQNCWFSIAFDIVVTRSFKICNWTIGLFDHLHKLSEVFKIQILYLDLFLGQIWAQKTKKRPFFPQIFDFLLLFVSIVIRCFGCFCWNCGKPRQSSPVNLWVVKILL